MVAKITFPKSIEAALNYNEKKVQKGQAECLLAVNYLREARDMNFYHKLNGFENRNTLNERAGTKTLHVSLNFDPSENLSEKQLGAIAESYMDKIGFGSQPYLVYRHHDAGHPHIHIVSTTIKEDGIRINTHNIGRNQSEQARKAIEQDFNLIRAEQQKKLNRQSIVAADPEKAVYGKAETKRSISNVVTAVFNQYKFTSLSEYNAVLKQYNVVADRGEEGGRIYQKRGLLYRLFDSNGGKAGVPIKASAFTCKPTLDNLEKKFTVNGQARDMYKPSLKGRIDITLAENPASMKELLQSLAKKQVYTVLRQNAEGRIYGITFVDNQTKCVFNGSDLGKQYSAAALQTKVAGSRSEVDKQEPERYATKYPYAKTKPWGNEKTTMIDPPLKSLGILEELMAPEQQSGNVPYQLLKKKKKRKKKNREL